MTDPSSSLAVPNSPPETLSPPPNTSQIPSNPSITLPEDTPLPSTSSSTLLIPSLPARPASPLSLTDRAPPAKRQRRAPSATPASALRRSTRPSAKGKDRQHPLLRIPTLPTIPATPLPSTPSQSAPPLIFPTIPSLIRTPASGSNSSIRPVTPAPDPNTSTRPSTPPLHQAIAHVPSTSIPRAPFPSPPRRRTSSSRRLSFSPTLPRATLPLRPQSPEIAFRPAPSRPPTSFPASQPLTSIPPTATAALPYIDPTLLSAFHNAYTALFPSQTPLQSALPASLPAALPAPYAYPYLPTTAPPQLLQLMGAPPSRSKAQSIPDRPVILDPSDTLDHPLVVRVLQLGWPHHIPLTYLTHERCRNAHHVSQTDALAAASSSGRVPLLVSTGELDILPMEFNEASPCLCRMIATHLPSDDPQSVAKSWHDHFHHITNKSDFHTRFRFYVEYDVILRSRWAANPGTFIPAVFQPFIFNEIVDRHRDAVINAFYQDSRASKDSRPHTASSTSARNQSFRGSNRSSDNTAPQAPKGPCFICGNKSHGGRSCSASSNGFITKGADGLWRTADNSFVCFKFNGTRGCSTTNCSYPHVCSRCGATHTAQSHSG